MCVCFESAAYIGERLKHKAPEAQPSRHTVW